MTTVDTLKDSNMTGSVAHRNFRGGKCRSSMRLYDNTTGLRQLNCYHYTYNLNLVSVEGLISEQLWSDSASDGSTSLHGNFPGSYTF